MTRRLTISVPDDIAERIRTHEAVLDLWLIRLTQ